MHLNTVFITAGRGGLWSRELLLMVYLKNGLLCILVNFIICCQFTLLYIFYKLNIYPESLYNRDGLFALLEA